MPNLDWSLAPGWAVAVVVLLFILGWFVAKVTPSIVLWIRSRTEASLIIAKAEIEIKRETARAKLEAEIEAQKALPGAAAKPAPKKPDEVNAPPA